MIAVALLFWGIATVGSAACSAGVKKLKAPPFNVEVDVTWADAPNDRPNECVLHGDVSLKLIEGTIMSSTFRFQDGDVVAIDWERKQIGGKYGEGVEVDFKKGRAVFKKKLTFCEVIIKRFGKGQATARVERDALLPSIEEQSITLVND
jgi:hypothetical protein